MRPLARPPIALAALLAALAGSPGAAGAQPEARPLQPGQPPQGNAEIATWAPAYTNQLLLPDAEGDVSLAADRGALWLATETAVVRLEDGVWSAPTWPADVSRIFALAPAGGGVLWAAGFEGDAWRLAGGRWTSRPAPTAADLYAAVALGADDAWAAGFDYEAATGVLVRWDAAGTRVASHPALAGRRLVALAADPAGGLWAGGCAPTEPSSDPVLLHLAPGAEAWSPVALPAAATCIHHLAFAALDRGLAAAGADLLSWDGAAWTAEGLSPPYGEGEAAAEWVRVAHVARGVGPDGPIDARWAIAGEPTWRGYRSGQAPWHSQGGAWQPAAIDDLGLDDVRRRDAPDAADLPGRPFLDLASDGRRAWSVDGLPQTLPAGTLLATLFALEDGTATLEHPLLREVTDLAARSDGGLWAVGREGSRPIARDAGGAWSALPGFRLDGGAARTGLDVAAPDAAWLWRPAAGEVDPAQVADAWRWDGAAWVEAPAPQRLLQLRARADGAAWARGGRGSRLLAYDPAAGGWGVLEGAPAASGAVPDCSALQRDGRLCEMLAAPFDTALATGGRPMGWLAGDDGTLHRWDGRDFTAAGASRGRVFDLELLDEGSGWAIAFDEDPPGTRPRSPRGVLLRLDGRTWREMPVQGALTVRGQSTDDVVWHLMAPVSADEVWLFGHVTTVGRTWPVVVRWTGVPSRGGRATVLWNCRVAAMSAAPAPDGGGTDLWLSGFLARGQDTCQLLVGRGGRAQALWPEPFPYLDTGPISRLRLRDVVDRTHLPALAR